MPSCYFAGSGVIFPLRSCPRAKSLCPVLRGGGVAGPPAEHPQEKLLARDVGGCGRDGGGLQGGEIQQ